MPKKTSERADVLASAKAATSRPMRGKITNKTGRNRTRSGRSADEKQEDHRKSKPKATNAAQQEPKTAAEWILKKLDERGRQEQLAWLSRPRLHTAIFADVWNDKQAEEIAEGVGWSTASVKLFQQFQKRKTERARKIEEIAAGLGWSTERLELFQQLVVEYRRTPNIENYVRVRRQFPEVEIQVAIFSGLEPLFALEDTFKKQGIDPQLIAAALDGDEPAVDALCLRLLECLIAKEKLPTSGPRHVELRRAAINDATINYLIVGMMETFDWHEEIFRIPASLVVLIRHQLYGGGTSDLYEAYRSTERFHNAAMAAGQVFHQTKKQISINKLATMAGVGRSTAARWLSHEEFQTWFEIGRSHAAGEKYPRLLKKQPSKAP